MPHTEPPSPKYYLLREHIRHECSARGQGEPIPSEAELCRMHGVSRTTVRKAIDDLANEGLVYRIQGKGTFVATPRLREQFVQYTAGLYEDLMSRGIGLQTEVLEQALVTADEAVAAPLQIALGRQAVKLRRLRSVNGRPVVLSDSYVPADLFPGIEHEDLADASLYGTMRERYGARLARGTRLVTVALSTEREAAPLRMPVGSPMLVINGVMHDTAGRPIESGTAWLRGDVAEIEIEVVSR